jgi:uncharacterized membrane protein YccC
MGTIFVVLAPRLGDSFMIGIWRMAGTLLGCTYSYLIYLAVGESFWLDLLLFLYLFAGMTVKIRFPQYSRMGQVSMIAVLVILREKTQAPASDSTFCFSIPFY